MLNIDDRLIKEVSPKIGPNALSVLLAIAIHLNQKTNRCFPSHHRLMELTGIGKNAVYDALNVLKKEGILSVEQKIDSRKKQFGPRVFRLSTRFISIFVAVSDADPLPESREPESREPESREPESREPESRETKQINESEQINKVEQINELERESAPAPAQISSTLNTSISDKDNSPARPAISFGDRPGARTPTELVNAMREFYQTYPGEREAGLMERAKARRYNLKQRETITAEWAAHVIKTNHGGDTYQMLNADLQGWYLRQPQFDKAPVNNLSSTQGPAYRAYQEPV